MAEAAKDLVLMMTRQDLEATLQAAMNKVASVAEPEVMTLKQAAELLGVHTKTLTQRLVRQRGCPVHYISPQDPRFRRSEILQWLSNQPKELSNGGS